jgi:hypothetical protein
MVHFQTCERLTIVRDPPRGLGHWGDQDPLQAAELVRRDVIGEGTCLPMIRFCAGFVIPVVVWHLDALATRSRTSIGPVLDRSVLADRLRHERDHAEPAPLQMKAFITVHPLPRARSALASVCGFTRAIGAVPRPPGASPWDAFEADYYGFTVTEVDGATTRTVVDGLPGPKHPLGGPAVQRRLIKEQLFDVALRAGLVDPTGLRSSA